MVRYINEIFSKCFGYLFDLVDSCLKEDNIDEKQKN